VSSGGVITGAVAAYSGEVRQLSKGQLSELLPKNNKGWKVSLGDLDFPSGLDETTPCEAAYLLSTGESVASIYPFWRLYIWLPRPPLARQQ